ncbi:ABC transporter permease [Microbacterium sp. NPDC057650]|uniref:ABC transporter permease n=1 Tax=unclassified Microbacterium TaxID=2609290 RepID=UPI003670B622
MSEPNSSRYVAPIPEEQPVTDAVRVQGKPSSLWRDAWYDLRRRPMFWISIAIVLVILLMAVWPTLFTQVSPTRCDLSNQNLGPEAGHPLGYTFLGCDIYSRIVWGARTSLSVGLLSALIGALIGLVMGAFAGYYGGWLDSLLSRIGDIFFSIPYILAAVVVMTVLSEYRNVFTLSFAIGGFAWAATARVVRAEVLRIRQSEFITASRALGRGKFSTLLYHVLPNSIAPLLVLATLSMAAGIVAEATLTFLGVGLPDDVMSWGREISNAQRNLRIAPESLLYPSIALTITVLAFIMLGELVRDAMDPRARATR